MKVGLDDFLAAGGTIERLLGLATDELRPPPQTAERSDEEKTYFTERGSTYWNKETKDGPVPVLLANFSAQIVEDIVEDDGAETRRLYRIRVVVRDQTREILVPDERFGGMNWPTEQIGPQAIVTAGMGSKDRLREAIQVLSPREIPKRRTYRHLGWIEHDDGPVYLHAGGAIGAEGSVSDIDVRIDPPLDRYVLPEPPIEGALRDAVRQSLALLDGLASDRVMFPLFSFLHTTAIQPPLESLHITGKTGVRKTELLALVQRHHGASMDAEHLPLSWSSTGNMIEAVAFLAKDCFLGVDDYSPTGSAVDVQRQNREADRVFRGRGNASGRGRLRPDGTPRPPKPPRAGICSTGEDVPHGHSMRARMIVLRVEEDEVNLAMLSERQEAAQSYPRTMAGFVRWLASHRTDILRRFHAEVPSVREALLNRTPHGRTATAGAKLILGLRVFLRFARECGAIDGEQERNLDRRGQGAILAVLAHQAEHQAASDPAQLFVELVGSALLAGDAHLTDRFTGSVPDSEELARVVGWQRAEPGEGQRSAGDWRARGPHIGWIDAAADAVYLNPLLSYRAAQKQGDSSPSRIGIGERALWDRLHEAGLLVSEDQGRHTKKIRVGPCTHGVLHLRLPHLLGGAGTTGTGPEDEHRGGGERDLFPISVPDLTSGGEESGTRDENTSSADGPAAESANSVPNVLDQAQEEGSDSAGDDEHSVGPSDEAASLGGGPGHDPGGACYLCGRGRFWRRRAGGPRVCGTCRPPTIDPADVEWLEPVVVSGGEIDE